MTFVSKEQAALLALDVYNHDDGAKVDLLSFTVGMANLLQIRSSFTGFYARSYSLPDNTIVISYRGTDANHTDQNPDGWANTITDMLGGYGAAISPIIGPQAIQALNFYDDVAAANPGKNIVVTGQSLGGGLAGIVAMERHAKAYVFEAMPFMESSIVDDVIQLQSFWGNDIKSYAVAGEFLSFLRASLGDDLILGTTYYDNISDAISPIKIHSQSIMTLAMFGTDYYDKSLWWKAAKGVIGNIYSDSFADDAGIAAFQGAGAPGDRMGSLLAYTTALEGGMPFGNVAARAMFNDMTDMGYAIGNAYYIPWVTQDMNRIVALYAAKNALAGTTQGIILNGTNLFEGILSRSSGNALSMDLGHGLWGAYADSISGKNTLLNDIKLMMGAQSEYLQDVDFGPQSEVRSISFALGSGVSLAAPSGEGVSWVIGSESSDSLLGSRTFDWSGHANSRDEILFGGAGDDAISGNGGNDILIGGDGNDYLVVDDGHATLLGDAGDDRFVLARSYSGASSSFVMDGGQGNDLIDLGQLLNGAVVESYSEVGGERLNITVGNVTVSGINVEKVVGTSSSDLFNGSGGMTYEGGSGDDVFYLKSGDVGVGGVGSDVFWISPGARVGEGGNAYGDVDRYHLVMDEGWTSLSSQDVGTLNGRVFVNTSYGETELVGLPTPDWYHPSPTWEVDNLGGGSLLVKDPLHSSSTFYVNGQPEVIQVDSASIMGYRWGYADFGDDVAWATRKGIVGAVSAAQVTHDDLSAEGSLYWQLPRNLVYGTVLSSAISSDPYGVLSTGLIRSAFVAAHPGETGLWVGPTDGSGAAIESLVIDEGSSTVGTMVIGASGYHVWDGSYDSGHASELLLTGSGNDLIVTGAGIGNEVALTGSGDDVIIGMGSHQSLSSGSGNDFIAPGVGSSAVDAGGGFDVLSYYGLGSGVSVTVMGGSGVVNKGMGSDSVSSAEVVIGTGSSDLFVGGTAGGMFVGQGGGDEFHLGGVATAVGGYGGDIFDIAPGSRVLLFGVDYSDRIMVGGTVLTGTTHDVSYVTSREEDGSYDVVERMVINGSIGSGEQDTLMLSWDGTTGQYVLPNQILSAGPSDSTRLLPGQDISEVVVNQGGSQTQIFIAGYRDGMAGLAFDTVDRHLGQVGPDGANFSVGDPHLMSQVYGYGPNDPLMPFSAYGVMDLFGFV